MKKKSIIISSIAVIAIVIAIAISLVFAFNHKDTKAYDSKLEQAQKYVTKLEYKKAEAAYLEAIDIDPKQSKAYVQLADVYMDNGHEDKAIEILDNGSNKVDRSNKDAIDKKKKEINKRIKSNKTVINNGSKYVTYKDKSYYWEYTGASFGERYFSDDFDYSYNYSYVDYNDNNLVSVDKNGTKKTIYTGNGHGNIWIRNDRLYLFNYRRSQDSECFSIKLDGTDKQEYDMNTIYAECKEGFIAKIGDNIGLLRDSSSTIVKLVNEGEFCYFQDDTIYYTKEDSVYDEDHPIKLQSIDIYGENQKSLADLVVYDTDEDGFKIFVPLKITCMQIIDDQVYFSYGGFDGTDYMNFNGKVVKVNKNGGSLTTVMNSKDYESFYAYKDGDSVKIVQHALYEPYTEYVSSEYADKALMRDGNGIKTVISPDEYDNLGDRLCDMQYVNGKLYFVAVRTSETTFVSYSYCVKDLKTNKITVYNKASFD